MHKYCEGQRGQHERVTKAWRQQPCFFPNQMLFTILPIHGHPYIAFPNYLGPPSNSWTFGNLHKFHNTAFSSANFVGIYRNVHGTVSICLGSRALCCPSKAFGSNMFKWILYKPLFMAIALSHSLFLSLSLSLSLLLSLSLSLSWTVSVTASLSFSPCQCVIFMLRNVWSWRNHRRSCNI